MNFIPIPSNQFPWGKGSHTHTHTALVIEEILSGARGWVIKGGTARTPHYEKLHVERNAVPCQEPALPTGNISQQVFIMPAEAPDLRDRQVFPLRPQSY